MTLNDLIDMLTELRDSDEEMGKRRIVAVYQPNYPLRADIDGVCPPLDKCSDFEDDPAEASDEQKAIHLLVGYAPDGLNPYAALDFWDRAGRG